ncbi:MAG: hypothetical protein MUO50_10480 [Longimicrobiales bacterium]|nr:hypothetical protein [Longimicrobiales bacterium]
MAQRKWAAILIALIVTIGYGIDVMAQGMFDAKPEESSDLPWKIAFVRDRNLWVMNANGSNQTRLTFSGSNDYFPAWSPDGSKIAFVSDRNGNFEIYVMNADGSNQTRLTFTSASELQPSWSPDGTKIVFSTDRDGRQETYIMNTDGSNQTRLTNIPGNNQFPNIGS